MPIKAVFFDFGGTLEDLAEDRGLKLEACREMLTVLEARGLRLDLSPEDLLAVIGAGMAAYKEWAQSTMLEASPEDIWSEWIFRQLPVPRAKVRELAGFLAVTWEAKNFRRSLKPGALETVRRLKDLSLIVGLISNAQSRTLVLRNLSQYGLAESISPILISSLMGIRKPHPAIFKAITCLAGVDPAESIYVGDTYSRDISGAFAAGFRGSVLIRSFITEAPDPTALPEGIRRSYVTVSTLEEIPDLLNRFA